VKTQHSNSLIANIRINADEIYEVNHWAKQLGVSIYQLRTAIEQVGPLVYAVCQHLKDEMNPSNQWYTRLKYAEPIGEATVYGNGVIVPCWDWAT